MYGVIGIRLIIATGANRSSRERPWLARITGTHKQFGYAREFVKPVYDYTCATRKGKNTYVYFFMAPGLYEVYYPQSWNPRSDARYFLRVEASGDWHKVTREEVNECLRNAPSESMS